LKITAISTNCTDTCTCIIPSDTPFFSLLVSLARKKEIEITAFGKKYSNYKGLWFVGWKPHPTGKSTFVFELNGKGCMSVINVYSCSRWCDFRGFHPS
jgi:hypothetical protein